MNITTDVQKVLLPRGFLCNGINSGVRKSRPDLGIVFSEDPSVVAGVFTENQYKAAPILYCQELLPSDSIRAIITNSGQANAATGQEGIQNNLTMAQKVAEKLGCQSGQVLTASTGVIGAQLEINKIIDGISKLIKDPSSAIESFAKAILTTDLVPKAASTDVKLSGGTVRIVGVCKGSGMIHPNMSTMLGYFLTDANLSSEQAAQLITKTTQKSFNMISVDGDSSTNDCVFIMANGSSKVGLTTSQDFDLFENALNELSCFLAKSIARDGEGATKLIEINIVGAPDEMIAKRAARGLVMSPLVKTAIHGQDPNWGRVVARLGADQVPIESLEKMSLRIQGILIFDNGAPLKIDLKALRDQLKLDTIFINIDLKGGKNRATAWGCDLSKEYVEINSRYLT